MPPSCAWAPAARCCWPCAQNLRERLQVPVNYRGHTPVGNAGPWEPPRETKPWGLPSPILQHKGYGPSRGPQPWGRKPRDYRAEFLESSHFSVSLWAAVFVQPSTSALHFSLTLFLLQSAEASENIIQIFTPAFCERAG